MVLPRRRDRLLPVRRRDDLVPAGGQAELEDVQVGGRVVRNEDARGFSQPWVSCGTYSRIVASSWRGLNGFVT